MVTLSLAGRALVARGMAAQTAEVPAPWRPVGAWVAEGLWGRGTAGGSRRHRYGAICVMTLLVEEQPEARVGRADVSPVRRRLTPWVACCCAADRADHRVYVR